jgi:SET domain-containing protein
MIMPYLIVALSEKDGWGVFTKEDIPADTVIEVSPVIVMSNEERKHIRETKLSGYVFNWGEKPGMVGLALGFASLYNHEYLPNCRYEMDYKSNLIGIKTIRNIDKGEELCINYNGDPENKTKVWFHEKLK